MIYNDSESLTPGEGVGATGDPSRSRKKGAIFYALGTLCCNSVRSTPCALTAEVGPVTGTMTEKKS